MIPVRNFSAGDALTTDWLNNLAKAVQELQQNAITAVKPPLARSANTLAYTAVVKRSGIIQVKNSSGADRNQCEVLGIDVPNTLPTDDLPTFQGGVSVNAVTPVAANHTAKFAILLEPIKAGAIGLACAAGVAPVQVNVVSATDTYADVNDGTATSLRSGSSGAARILWKDSGTGIKWAIVRIGPAASKGTASNPAAMLPVAFETEAAQTDAWDLASPAAGTDGVTIRVQTRMAYNEAGDQTLYAFWRTFTFSNTGNLLSISAETRVPVDTPEAC